MTLLDSAAGAAVRPEIVYDFIGVGFGPSNLALAIAARELDPARRGRFFERRACVDWHPGLLFDSSRMQISFLKDLVTLRNPSSPFSFLQYTKACGRLEHFVNLSEFQPTRWEYRDYLRWVAQSFADQVRYGCNVRKVTPAQLDTTGHAQLFQVEVEDVSTGTVSTCWTRNLIYAAGGTPRYPAGCDQGPDLIHSGEYLHRFPQRFGDRERNYRFAVIGDGQSAGEVLVHQLQSYPNAQIHLFMPGYALRPVDRSPFVNDAFQSAGLENFHASSDERRAMLRDALRNTNYGVLAPELIDQIYRADYLDTVRGTRRLFIHRFSRLVSVERLPQGLRVSVEDQSTGSTSSADFDGVALATGYDRSLCPRIFADVLPSVCRDDAGLPRLSRNYRVQTEPGIAAGLYVQGFGESSHGLGDTLLSMLPFRARDIFTDICARTPATLSVTRLHDVEYPPRRHLESDPERLYAVLECCRFATLVSAGGTEIPVVTHVPLILDRSRGVKGVLFGHMDRGNPHVELLQGRRALAIFHGPDAYISPHVYQTVQLPTWNSISVHVSGRIRLLETPAALLDGLASISATDARPGAYRLDLQHPAIDKLTGFIVGFELEIEELIGRFKLSQDRNASDQKLAALELAERSEKGERALIEQALGWSLPRPSSVPQPSADVADETPRVAAHADWHKCIHELFEEQVERTPTRVAVIYEAEQLTYAELDARANQLAWRLRQAGIGVETLVGLCLERSPDLMVALLGILKAGAAFVPLDPEYPLERLRYMLSDTAAAMVVTQARFKDRFAQIGSRVFCMDGDRPEWAAGSTESPAVAMNVQNLAYCVFTSGSTGKPKGVAMPHRGLVNHILHMRRALRHTSADRVLQFTAITADGSLQEIFTAWLTGAALVLPVEKAPSMPEFMRMLSRYEVSVVSVPTAYWHFWVGELVSGAAEWPESVRLVILGGEKVIPERFRQWRQLPCTRGVAWVQDYGPSETTVSCTAFEATATHGPEDLCIGQPNANMRVYILDDEGRPVPAGEVGELCISGAGLARGYWNRPGLTAQAFVPNPFGEPGSRLYKSGDLARYLPDGHLQFLERRDHQVKIRGHRIELSEIEGALLKTPGVRQCAVLALESASGNPRLVAYVVADDFDEPGARQHLASLLPQTMLPSAFLVLASLPTAGGKVDRAQLRAMTPAVESLQLTGASEMEQTVARLWADINEQAPPSLDEDFFAAGGDSLRALRLLSKAAALTGVEVTATEFFRARTIRGLAALLQARTASLPMRQLRHTKTARQPASNAQQRLWFLDQLQQGAATYSVPCAYRITGPLSIARLDQCLTALVARHEALRTALVLTTGKQLLQQIVQPLQIRSRVRRAAGFVEAMQLAQVEAGRPFALTTPPLLRSVCIQVSEQEALWLLVLHHSVCDAWSVGLLWRELMAMYGGVTELPPVAFQYGDYAQWQSEWLTGTEADAQRKFWREQLAGELPPLQLARRPVPGNLRTTEGALEGCSFPAELTKDVRATAARHHTTEFAVLLSAFLATLYRITRQDQILIGVPVACRTFGDAEEVVGYITNTLPLRIVFQPEMRFAELLEQTTRALANALAHQDLPFDQIVDALGAAREGSTNPLFQAMFVMQTTPVDVGLRLGEASVQEVVVHSGTSKVDLTCTLRSWPNGLEGELEYSTDVLSASQARRYVDCFQHLLGAAAAGAECRMDELAMLSPAEAQGLIERTNTGFATWPDFSPAHAHFEAQARLTPDATAIECSAGTISYETLNHRANRLARCLLSQGVGLERLVGICMDRSIEMVVAVLASLKAGAGFVPLDPDFPLERLQRICDDARVHVVLTQALHVGRLESLQPALLVEDTDARGLSGTDNVSVEVSGSNVAYIYYTSGSTGTPKGVVLDHLGVMNRLGWLRRQYVLHEGERSILKTPLIFDLAIWEIFGPLMAGATILMADARAENDVAHISELLGRPRTVFVYFVPSMLESFLNFAPRRAYPDLRWVAVTGEAVPTRLLERFVQHFPLAFHNIYGNTETSELALWEGTQCESAAMIPIGRAVGIYRLFILDTALQPVPPGVPGEIHVAGVGGLARGYQGLPALTAQKFIPNPYAVVPGERLYKTGDLARLTEDGAMEYVGRTDTQVKVRGCRIETAEVEAVLSRHPAVHSCAVILRRDGLDGGRLVAYVVVGAEASANALGAHMEKSLPRYMLPSAFVFLSEVPLTPSGKLDRSRLPAPAASDFEARTQHEPPQSEVEMQLAGIWMTVLGIQQVGRTDNFFSLGGNSLQSVQVLARVKDDFGVEVRVRDFFSFPTLEGLARLVEEALVTYVGSLSDEEVEQQLQAVRS